MNRFFASLAATVLSIIVNGQVVLEPPAKTIKCDKAEVTCLAMAPKGDRILVGTDKGAELRDLNTGKRIASFSFNEDGSTVVYYCAFNENGEYVVLIGLTGKREVWEANTGKQDKMLAQQKWIPDAVRVKQLGLKMGNSNFDRFYQQMEAKRGDVTAKADKDGVVVFTDKNGAAVQTLKYPENKDQHHRAPCYFIDKWFITGTDDGRVLFYELR